jgi:hypothetical protein
MSLPAADEQYLSERGIAHQVLTDGGEVCVLFPGWQLPSGLSVSQTDVLLRLSPGYPDIPPDMWWTDPAVLRADGSAIPATEVRQPMLGRTWQRWSRHFQAGQWQSGIDGLESFVALIRNEFCVAARGAA